jgi:hypothetical protein
VVLAVKVSDWVAPALAVPVVVTERLFPPTYCWLLDWATVAPVPFVAQLPAIACSIEGFVIKLVLVVSTPINCVPTAF